MQENPLPPVRPAGLEPTRRKGHQSLNLACLPKFHHGHIIFNCNQPSHARERPASAPSGTRTHTPHNRGTGPSIRRVYRHSATGTKASQSRRTTGSYGNIISRPPARAQADNTRPHRNTRHNKRRTKRRGTIPCSPWTVQDSNLRPTGCKPDALPTELTVQSVACGSRTRPRQFC